MIMAEGKKLSRTTLEEKLMIIDYFKKSNKTQNETVEHFKDQFSISSSSFSEWLRNEEELRQRYMKALNGPSSAANLVIRSKRRATYKYGPINDAMFEAVTERIQNNLPITQPILRKYWMKFAKQYGVTDPKRMDCFSHGWLENFKKRLGLTRLNGTLKELNNNGKNMGEHDISSGKRRFDELMDVQRENATENEPYTGNTNGKRQGQCGKRRCLQTGSPATQFDLIKASSDYTTVNFSDVAQNTIARNKEAAVNENSKTNGQKNDNSNRNDNTITNNTKNMNIGTSVDNKNINRNNGDVSGNSNEKNKINNGGSGNAGDISGSNPEKGKQSHTHSHAKTKTGIHNRSNLQQILMNPDNNKSPYLISNLNALGYEKSSLNKMADYRTDENINNKISGRILTNTNDIPLQPSHEINSSSTQLQSYAMDPFSNSTNNTKFRQMLSVSGGTTNDLLKHKIQEQSLSFDENLVMLAPLPPIPPSMNAIANNKHIGRLGIPYKLDDNESIENAIRKAGNLNNPKNNNIKGDNATSETTINFDSGNSIKCSIDDMERLLFIYADQFFKQFKTTSLFKESREVFEEFKTKFMTDKIAYLAQNKSMLESYEELRDEARTLDEEYKCYSDQFVFPTLKSMGLTAKNPELDPNTKVNYLCGNSLGLMPVSTREYLSKELDAWGARGVESHFRNEITTNWVDVDLPLVPKMASIVGAKESEVAIMGTLTMNLNSLLVSFYQPNVEEGRTKILFEKGAFPSDYYALYNMAKLKGLDPDDTLVQLAPEDGSYSLTTEQILAYLDREGEKVSLLCFPGIQYYSGQLFDIEQITAKAHEKGCIVGWDLAHAAGNIDLKLHKWNVDFAAWCSYKYLNSGPGAIGGIFVNEKYFGNNDGAERTGRARLAGWWGNDSKSRFQMLEKFNPIESALGFRQSNPSVLDVCALNSSLDVFMKCGGISELRKKSIKLTCFLEKCLKLSKYYRTIEASNAEAGPHFIIITPENPLERGAQLSVLFKPLEKDVMMTVFQYLNDRGIVCDERRPNVIRLAPTPLYNTFGDCIECVILLEEAMENL